MILVEKYCGVKSEEIYGVLLIQKPIYIWSFISQTQCLIVSLSGNMAWNRKFTPAHNLYEQCEFKIIKAHKFSAFVLRLLAFTDRSSKLVEASTALVDSHACTVNFSSTQNGTEDRKRKVQTISDFREKILSS